MIEFDIIPMEEALDSLVSLGYDREKAYDTVVKWFGKQTTINDVELNFIEIQLLKDKEKNGNSKRN